MDFLLKDAEEYLEKQATLKGWAGNVRSSGKIYFIQFRDGTGRCQAVVDQKVVDEQSWADTGKLTIESSLIITGVLKADTRSPSGLEMQVEKLHAVQIADEYPIGKKEHGPDFLLDERHLWLRSESQWAIQRVRNTTINAIYKYLNDNGFVKFDSPILTPNACEGTTTLFEVPYFDEGAAYLSQSGQLYLEAGIMSLGRCFDFGPVFRAEKSKTRRHLTEFWMMDAEAAYVEHDENLKIQEELIRFVIREVLAKNESELKILERDTAKLKAADAPFKKMTHAEAVKYLQAHGSDIKDGEDLGGDDETILTAESDVPIFIEKWPKEIKAFYMKPDATDPSVVLCADLMASEGFGEIIGGSQREDDYEALKKRMEQEKLPVLDYQWYLDLRKYGSVPHSGFGIGLERLVGWLCGTHHIRETIPFPRLINRIKP